ncbi:hypothetical protein [Aurantimonas sp. VKM B-3413]|nr:hypothetical protein [Aurantimonas sp. VKM B-3413]MCB8836479.1 hypothetical protein [Aurantimonas sp. VKM B-3413]
MRLQPYASEAALPASASIGAGGLACVQTAEGLKLTLCDGAAWSTF